MVWFFLVAPQIREDQPRSAGIVAVAYSVMDLVLLGTGLRLVLDRGGRPPAFYLMVASLLTILIADAVAITRIGSYQAGNYLDAIWLMGNLAFGATALHPTMAELSEPARRHGQILSRRRLAGLTAAALEDRAAAGLAARPGFEPDRGTDADLGDGVGGRGRTAAAPAAAPMATPTAASTATSAAAPTNASRPAAAWAASVHTRSAWAETGEVARSARRAAGHNTRPEPWEEEAQ